MNLFAWLVIGFFCGSLPFAVWITRLAGRTDARAVGDGNPGAANAWRSGGWPVGVLVLVLDFAKGALPVSLAHYGAGLRGGPLMLAAIAPVLGHVFSPWLHGRGGKGLTVTFGIWFGLTLVQGPLLLGVFMTVFYLILAGDAWVVLFSLGGLGGVLLAVPDLTAWWPVWAANSALLLWTHRREWGHRPRLKAPGVKRPRA